MNSDMAMPHGRKSTEILNKGKQEFLFGLKKAMIGFNDVVIVNKGAPRIDKGLANQCQGN